MRYPDASYLLVLCAFSCARSVTPVDGGAPPTDVAAALPDVAVSVPCGAAAPLGTVLWRTPFEHDHFLRGPMAADAEGNTFFVHDGSLLGVADPQPYIASLDRCGAMRWRAPWSHPVNRSVQPFVMLAGDRILAANVDLRAFDAASGAAQWTVDLVAFAMSAGLGDASGENAIRSVVVDASGVAYVLIQTPGKVAIVRVDPSGAPSLLAHIDDVPADASATDLVLDAQGGLDVPISETNVSPGPGEIHAFALDGTPRWVTPLAVVDYQDHLTVGSDFIVSGDTGTILSTDGTIRHETHVDFAGPGATDAADDLFIFGSPPGGADGAIASFDRAGTRRWSSSIAGSLAYEYDGGPVLGERTGFYVLNGDVRAADGGYSAQAELVAFDLATGAQTLFTYPGSDADYVLLTRAGVVFVLDGNAVAVSSGGEVPATAGAWTTPRGGLDRRGAARGR